MTACGPAAETAPETVQIETVTPAWQAAHMDPAQAEAYISGSEGVTVLDIRTPAEFEQGHITGATLIDFKSSDFADNISKLDKDAAYVVHCASGGRSTKSLEIFKAQGFTNITHMDGGIKGWQLV